LEVVLLLVILAAIGFYLITQRKKGSVKEPLKQMKTMGSPELAQPKPVSGARIAVPPARREAEDDWLAARWAMAQKPASERPDIFPDWYFDPVTERQLERLEQDSIPIPAGINKGKASDLIGLRQPISYKDEPVLKLFKRSTRGVSESQGRHIAALLLSDPANKAAWDAKPPETMQREFFRWFNISMPKTLTMDQATARIEEEKKRLGEEELDYWYSFESVVNDLDDPEIRQDYEVKKAPLSVIREAVVALKNEGVSSDDIGSDLDRVVERMTDLRPDLMRTL